MEPRLDLLTLLCDHLETVKEQTFDMMYWQAETSCGTTCCAIGHACQLKEFMEAGLHFSDWLHEPAYQGLRGFNAIANCLKITKDSALFLFDPEEYDTNCDEEISKEIVVKRIRDFIAEHSQEKEGN